MTDKRKNIAMIAPTYEEGWLFRFARQRQWTREETFVVYESPADCLDHLRETPRRDRRFKYSIDAQDLGSEYEFKVWIEHWRRWFEKRPDDIRTVIGHIAPYEGDDQRSLITIRTYPRITARTLTSVIFWTLLLISCGAMNSGSFIVITDGRPLAALLIAATLGLFFLSMLETFVGRQHGLDIVRTLFIGKRK